MLSSSSIACRMDAAPYRNAKSDASSRLIASENWPLVPSAYGKWPALPASEYGMAAQPQVGFLECARMRARPVGPAQSSTLHDFARSGPTKEAHRRALYRSGGLLRSVASDQGKRSEAGPHRYAVACVPITVGIMVLIDGPNRVARRPRRNCSGNTPRISLAYRHNCPRRRGSGSLNRPRRGRDPAPGRVRPMPSPGGNYHPARQAAGVKVVRPRPPAPASWEG
jgi:hypothetical protein